MEIIGEKEVSPDSLEHTFETQQTGRSDNDEKIASTNQIQFSDNLEQNKPKESEAHVIDVVCKVFKGAVIGTKLSYEPSNPEKSSFAFNLSRNTSYSSELSNQSEEFTDIQDEEI